MPRARYSDSRDKNDTPLTHALEQMGCVVWHLGRSPCDKLVMCPDGRLELAEIKNPENSWELTDTEIETQRKLHAKGRDLWILQTIEDCAAIVENRPYALAVNASRKPSH